MSRYVSMYLVAVHLLAYSECEPVGCGPGTTGPGIDACVMCESGKYKGINGASECVACESPMFLSSNRRSCTALPELNHSLALCETCVPGKASKPFDNNMRCEDCERGKSQSRSGQLSCSTCAVGKYSDEVAHTSCVPCAQCDVGDYRDGCGYGSHASSGECTSCLIECAEGMMATACINREGVVGKAPVCKHKEFLTRTPLCQIDRTTKLVDRGLGLGGFDFETIFGGNENEVDFQCSRVCDARGEDGGTVDTMTCDGPFACNRQACSMEASYLDTNLNEFRVGRACPVEISAAEASDPLAHIHTLNPKRRVTCQKCSECGSTGALVETQGLRDWGRGCASECSKVECDIGEIFDWTDHLCKPCAQLSNVSLCAYDQTVQDSLAVQDVSGYRAKIVFRGCQAKDNDQLPISYGQCECCRTANLETDCSEGTSTASYHAGCSVGCAECMHKQDRVLTSKLKYVTVSGREEPLYCQLRECAQDSSSRAQTGLKDYGAMCVSSCEAMTCGADEVQLACTLPHNTRCRTSHPRARREERVIGHVSAHANLFEHPDSAKYHFSSFENVLVNVDALNDGDKHQCVWNAVDIRDNDMNPAGVSFTFFPPAKTYAYELTEYGSKFCHPWDRNPRLWYPLLPLQNTVSFDSAFPRRLLLNASARVVHYEYSGVGHERVPDQLRLDRPTALANVFSGDLYLSIDLLNTPNATLAVMVPDDRKLAAATWIPALMFSTVVADATARSTTAGPALLARASMLAATQRRSFGVSVSMTAAVQSESISSFSGVHCEPTLCRFAVPGSHTGEAWVSANKVPGADTSLSADFPEMLLARRNVFGAGFVSRTLATNTGGPVSRIRSSTNTDSCHLWAVVGVSLVCHDVRQATSRAVEFGTGDVLRIETDSRIVDVCVVGGIALVVMQLSRDNGQQILSYNAETGVGLDVSYLPADVVAVGSNALANSDIAWVLRKTVSQSEMQFTLEQRRLREYDLDAAPALRLFDTSTVLADILGEVFVENPDTALSVSDTYEMSVSDENSVFLLFGLVGAEQRIIQIYDTTDDRTASACTLVSQYPGLDAQFSSSAWMTDRMVVLYSQDRLYTAACEDGRLLLNPEPGMTLPRSPFVPYAGSYLSLAASGGVVLYSHIEGVRLAGDPKAVGSCVFVSTPSTTLSVDRHVNAHLRSAVVIVDDEFVAEQVVEYEQGHTVKTVHSMRALSSVDLFVAVHLRPLPRLPRDHMYPYLKDLSFDSGFWESSVEHFMDVQATLPCAASLWFAGQTIVSDETVCATVRVVIQATLVESWSDSRTSQFELGSGDVYVKHEDGAITHYPIATTSVITDVTIHLYHGATLTQILEVDRFSSTQFEDSALQAVGVCQTCGWQRLRQVTSAHAVAPKQPMLVQVYREAQTLESWSTQRSLAVDALQLLVVLTTGSVRPARTAVDPYADMADSGWLAGYHCCSSMDLLGRCEQADGDHTGSVLEKTECAAMTDYESRPCVAKTFLLTTVYGSNLCHCHSTCKPSDMQSTTQGGVSLMISAAA